MKHSSQAATTAAQSAGAERGSSCPSAQPTAVQSAGAERGSSWIQTQFGNEIKYYVRNGCVLPMMMAGRSFGVFLTVYLVVLLGLGIADYSMPVLITRVIPYESIGSYTSLRMGTHTGGIALGSMAAGAALGSIPAAMLLLFSGCMQLGSGLIYWLICRKHRDELL